MSSRLPKAVAAGYVVACCLTVAAAQAAQLLFPLESHHSPPTGYLALAVAGCFIASVMAAYVAARLAPRGKVFAALALLVLMFAATAVAISRLAPQLIRPPVVLPLTTM